MSLITAIDQLAKARRERATDSLVPASRVEPGQAYLVDPLWASSSLRYRDKPFGLSYDVLRLVAQRNSVIAAILQTRINQVSSFWRPARIHSENRGFAVRHRDPKHHPTKVEQKLIERSEEFIRRCGNTDRPRDKFYKFIRKLTRDSLCLDQACIEKVRDRKDRLAEFYCVDGATLRILTSPDRDQEDGYVQLIGGRPAVWFTPHELAFCIRNPRTDLRVSGYGYPEIEMVINNITAHLHAEEYNRRFFVTGAIPKGLLYSEGAEFTAEMLEGLRRSWASQLTGIVGSHRLAALSVPAGSRLNYIDLQKGNAEMEFARWMEYLVNVACACFQIDPAEVNFPNRGGPSQPNPLFQSGEESRLIHSTDKGLRPLMEFLAEEISEQILWELEGGEDFLFEFEGIERSDHREETSIAEIQSRFVKTVNELRAEAEDKPVEGGDIILNPVWLQWMQMQDQKKQQEEAKQQQQQQQQQQPGNGTGNGAGGGWSPPQYDEQGNLVGLPEAGEAEEQMFPSGP